ncbi:MAG: hypothetical protein AVDCRST_MAG23-2763, partial [uncultured Sphingosinicella sp.]
APKNHRLRDGRRCSERASGDCAGHRIDLQGSTAGGQRRI